MKKEFKQNAASLLFVATLAFAGVGCSSSTTAHVTPEQPREWALQNYRQYSDEAAAVTDDVKEAEIEKFRQQFKKSGYRMHQNAKCKLSWQEAQALLQEDGRFSDLIATEADYFPADGILVKVNKQQLEEYQRRVWLRLAVIAEEYMAGRESLEATYTDAFLKSILHYGELEIARNNYVPRFHESCFMIPTAASNIYFTYLERMDAIESGEEATDLEKQACDMLKVLGLQVWTQPLRHDETDNDVTCIERFRNHVWWVGGNGLAFRSLLPVACMIKSIPMIDVLSEVSQRGISRTSQTTFDTSFWTEGFTADGAGWGHGMQCLIWGYPISGTTSALNLMSAFQGTVWERKLSTENKEALFTFLQGSNYYNYKGFSLPCLGRGSFSYVAKGGKIGSLSLVNTALKDWRSSFTPQEIAELEQFKQEAESGYPRMENYADGLYNGTRYFFNNDDFMKKNDDYHILVNMASVRCDGIESASFMADGYNFTSCDGLTLFQRTGHEYMNVYGAFDVLQAPGITARLGVETLEPLVNWRGFCSKKNFAGGATLGGANGVAGYDFEKMNASYKENVNDTVGRVNNNHVLYGVQARKGYFLFGDYFLALGAGITNLKPEMEGDIHTSIEQTSAENKLYLLRGGKKQALKQGAQPLNSSAKSLTWLVQEGKFAYTSLSANTYYQEEVRPSNWEQKNITNKGRKGLPLDVNVLQLWVDHGQTPVNDTYAYVVYAGKGEPAATLPFTVLRNDANVQAAASLKGDVIEAVFYNNEESLLLADGSELSVSAPCVVYLEKGAAGWTISVTDATMNNALDEIVVTFGGKAHQVAMPKDLFCGKPAVQQL